MIRGQCPTDGTYLRNYSGTRTVLRQLPRKMLPLELDTSSILAARAWYHSDKQHKARADLVPWIANRTTGLPDDLGKPL